MTETTNVNLLHFVFDLEDEKVTQKEIADYRRRTLELREGSQN